jgi:hypothetical protein
MGVTCEGINGVDSPTVERSSYTARRVLKSDNTRRSPNQLLKNESEIFDCGPGLSLKS